MSRSSHLLDDLKHKVPFLGQLWTLWIVLTILSIPYWIIFAMMTQHSSVITDRIEATQEALIEQRAAVIKDIAEFKRAMEDNKTSASAEREMFLKRFEEEITLQKEPMAEIRADIKGVRDEIESIKPRTIQKLNKLLARIEKS